MPNSKCCLWHVTSQNWPNIYFTINFWIRDFSDIVAKWPKNRLLNSECWLLRSRHLLPSVQETVDRKKSGYFSVMKCFGFIILTRSVNTNLCNLKFWPVFTNLSTCYISFASLYFLHLQNDASLKVKTVVHEDCDRWLFFHEKKKMNSFFAPSIVERRNFFSTKWCDRFCQP